jgi:DNA-binding LytR/AlgR family response regulator
MGIFSSVKQSVDYLSANAPPDLIFADVQLPDGLSVDIFDQINLGCLVVFITGHDPLGRDSFGHNAIDCLLKPIGKKDLDKSLAKYESFERHFMGNSTLRALRQKPRSRLLVRKGMENIALKTDDIVIIYTEEKLVFAIDKDGKKYIVDQRLADLQNWLDRRIFFRANRQYLVNIAFIRSYRAYEKVKLQVNLTMPGLEHLIIVSQDTAPVFRKWISEL